VIRRAFLSAALLALSGPLAAEAQPVGKVYRIGVLSPDVPPPGLLEEFKQELGKLGYMEGRNVVIELRHAARQPERLTVLANELVQRKVDVILTVNTVAAKAAKKTTTTVAIVMTRVADPVSTGLVSSLARPGGNITGLNFMPDELSAKRLEFVKEVIPGLSRVAVMWDARNPGPVLTALEVASARLSLRCLSLPVRGSQEDLRGAFEAAARDRVEALFVVDDALITNRRVHILNLAAKHGLPVSSLFKPFVEAGGLMAYGPNTSTMYRRAAHFVDKILTGAKPADLPVEQPTQFDLIINLKTAKALGLTIPPSLLGRADQVIE
jgi:putative ABC transport system substrate-binding protein